MHRDLITSVFQTAARTVGSTYGPNGSFAILTDGKNSVVTKDGVSVLRHMKYSSNVEQGIFEIIKEASLRTLTEVGDGTTTTILLAENIYSLLHPVDFHKKEDILAKAIAQLSDVKKKASQEDLFTVAMTATAGDEILARIVVDAVITSAEKGYSSVTAEANSESNTSILEEERLGFKGTLVDNAFYDKSGDFLEWADAVTIVSLSEIAGEENVISLVEKCLREGIEKIMILAPSFALTALSAMAVNNHLVRFAPIVISAGDAAKTKLALETLAISLEATAIGIETGVELRDATQTHFAQIKSLSFRNSHISCEVKSTDGGEVRRESARILALDCLAKASDDEERDMYRVILGILNRGSITIQVGAASLGAAIERKDRTDDCVNAVELALSGGVVAGAGRAYEAALANLGYDTPFGEASSALILPITKSTRPLDPYAVAETALTQAIELAFLMKRSAVVVLNNKNKES